MRIRNIVIGLLLIPVAIVGSTYVVSELGGEVVVLHRQVADNSVSPVRVWVVGDAQVQWIEHGAATDFWMQALVADPVLTVEQGGQARRFHAAPDPDNHGHYHRLRAAKYGWADSFIALFSGGTQACEATPVRLQPLHI
ncbi:MAG: hypothetical protein HN856_07735 [Gammaproteobacteria bacterium]|nr:hypothetical protein [Gammaproteobacteria bacterium]